MKNVAVIGYSGHAYVAIEALKLSGQSIFGYVQKEKTNLNPYNITYLGSEDDFNVLKTLKGKSFFTAIGNNSIRRKVTEYLLENELELTTAIHPKANLSPMAKIEAGVLICQGSSVNPLALIKKGTIINTGAIIEHECYIDEYVHIAPGATIAGNVSIGANSFIGANSVIKQGLKIGSNVTIGAGSVVIKNIPDNETWFGNPAIKRNLNESI
jgi:sugar O-acyltransferase (sialic acid O-acetyltransferase NeuD family)